MPHTRPPIAIIVAIAENGVIGDDNKLLWRLKTDLKRFRALTLGKPLIVGRKTFQSIGKALPGRHMIVMTRDPRFRPEGVAIASSMDDALRLASDIARMVAAPEIMVAGGSDVYRQALPLSERLYVTRVASSPEGDATFPDISASVFRQVHREAHHAGIDDEHAFAFIDYVRHDSGK
jgi:dihydrofolate reductase